MVHNCAFNTTANMHAAKSSTSEHEAGLAPETLCIANAFNICPSSFQANYIPMTAVIKTANP
jgi:hypothetical protein